MKCEESHDAKNWEILKNWHFPDFFHFRRDHEFIVVVSAFRWVFEIKILGVTISDSLSLSPHVSYLTSKSAQIMFALHILCSHGLSRTSLWEVSCDYILGWLTYASPAWWGFCTIWEHNPLGAMITGMVRRHFLPLDQRPLREIIADADMRLFCKVSSNSPWSSCCPQFLSWNRSLIAWDGDELTSHIFRWKLFRSSLYTTKDKSASTWLSRSIVKVKWIILVYSRSRPWKS